MAAAYPKTTAEHARTDRDSGTLPWFALQVRPRYEKLVALVLENKGFSHYLPLYTSDHRWSDRNVEVELPLFPGYLFCRLDLKHRILPVLTTPGVIKILGVGHSPVSVDEAEIHSVQDVLRSGLAVRPWPMPRVGERVVVEAGPLRGVEGVLTSVKNKTRLIVSVSLLQRGVAVEVDAQWARPINKAPVKNITERRRMHS
jgi:transcription antitermination factor NusG